VIEGSSIGFPGAKDHTHHSAGAGAAGLHGAVRRRV
jgi:hypothetical protein